MGGAGGCGSRAREDERGRTQCEKCPSRCAAQRAMVGVEVKSVEVKLR